MQTQIEIQSREPTCALLQTQRQNNFFRHKFRTDTSTHEFKAMQPNKRISYLQTKTHTLTHARVRLRCLYENTEAIICGSCNLGTRKLSSQLFLAPVTQAILKNKELIISGARNLRVSRNKESIISGVVNLRGCQDQGINYFWRP